MSGVAPLSLEEAIERLTDYLYRYVRRKPAFSRHAQDSPRRAGRLLDLLGRPGREIAIVRVIGTKGKGSTAAMLEAVLRAAGYRTGLYTSPHLHSPRERIRVQGEWIGRAAFAAALRALHPLLEGSLAWDDLGPATLFEGLTATAIAHFARCGVEIAVVEAGMGGQHDATQSLPALLTVLTPFALDHQAYLGETLAAIAAEKAGAIPPGGVVVSAPQPEEAWETIGRRCREVGARLIAAEPAGETLLGLDGPHQAVNAGVVRAAVEVLRAQGWAVPPEAVSAGLRDVTWPGRLETVAGQPLTVVDGARNPSSAQALAAALRARQRTCSPRKLIFLLGCSADKDLPSIVAPLATLADGAIVVQAHHHRAADPAALAALWRGHGVPVEIVPPVEKALLRAREWAGPDGWVCAGGSFFVVAEVREALGMAVREPWPEPAGESPNRSDSLAATSTPCPHPPPGPGR